MKFKNFIKVFCLSVGVAFAVACSDDEEKVTPEDEGGEDTGGVVEVTEQLPAPTNVTYTATQTSLRFDWGKVTGATSYEASLAEEGSPNDANTVEVANPSCNFASLEGNTTYVFTVRALYSPNPGFNSDYAEITAKTLDYAKVDTPTGLVIGSLDETEVTIYWDVVSGVTYYRVKLENGGAEIENKVQTAIYYSNTGLTEGESYTFSVQALAGDGSEESNYDSEWATIEFETPNPNRLTPPAVSVAHKTHGIAILEWELTDEMLAEQPLSSNNDTYNFRLSDASGKVLRQMSGYNSFNFQNWPLYRISWGGLTAGTTYKLEMQRVSTTSTYESSKWTSVEVTTDAAPDTSGYLLYWDFDNVPFGACSIYGAYGFKRTWTTGEHDWSNPDSIPLDNPGSGNYNTIYVQGCNSSYDQSYFDTYFPGIVAEEVLDGSSSTVQTYMNGQTYNVAATVGHVKFGGSSNPAWLSLPAFSGLSDNSTIYLEIDACPFYEVNGKGWYSPSNVEISNRGDEHNWFYVSAPGATIVEVEGETSADAVMTSASSGLVRLKNVTHETMATEADSDPYRFTHHKVKISGVGPETRIAIYQRLENDGAQQRMWVDNILVSKAD